ncbi:MAG: DUF2867 domain-containing protein [Campylobacterota bacterium]|nr:DUF2867 domain-containing protein [Campylobacterota bacterium]
MTTPSKKIAIFGATGYIGLILTNRLVAQNIPLKLFVRNPRRLLHLQSNPNVEICDIPLHVSQERSLENELYGCTQLYYLIHSMQSDEENFEVSDREIAALVSRVAQKASVVQIIYLGALGLETPSHPLSLHLRSRQQTATILRSSGVSVSEIRAGIIIGAGSASFEIMRALGSKLPFIPRLDANTGQCHPIDVEDVILYLLDARGNPLYKDEIIEIGMQRSYSYDEMLVLFAQHVFNRPVTIRYVRFLAGLDLKYVARIIAFLSALPYELTYPLSQGMHSLAIKDKYDASAKGDIGIHPIGFIESIKRASQFELERSVESFWSIPLKLQVLSKEKDIYLYHDRMPPKGFLYERRIQEVKAVDIDSIFNEVKKIGGKRGYWSPLWMWKTRAFIDKMMGGPGLNIGRRTDANKIRVGERIDFWIVTDYFDTTNKKALSLKGRLRSPGDSWLRFALNPDEKGQWYFSIRADFQPSGIFGYLYWYSLFFIHKYIFRTMIDSILEKSHKNKEKN